MQEIKTILCPVDFSEFSERAARYAAAFAQQYHSRLIVYHCVSSAMALSGYPEGIPVGWQDWSHRVNTQMENFLLPCKLYNIDVSSRIETGEPAAAILEIAKKEHVDLIVMGTHGFSGYEAILMGSVTNKVIHKATAPVLAVCKATKTVLSSDPDEPLMLGKILCAVDPANIRLQMLSQAMSLARSNRSTLYFFTVGQSSETNRVLSQLREIIFPEKEEFCRVEFIQTTGNTIEEILKAIQHFEIDLVVMGHHSIIPMAFETLGSVTLRVIPRSNCAVLVVRD